MTKPIFLLIISVLFAFANPIEELKVGKPPTEEQARILNYSDEEYEVFFNSKGEVEYRDYKYGLLKATELPFTIKPKAKDKSAFAGKRVNLKVDNGWLVGIERGEWGGSLFWFNEKGTRYEKIVSGNIKNLFRINGQIYAVEGLAHLSLSRGQIFTVSHNSDIWTTEKKLDLPTAPYAATLTDKNEFLIVTSKELLIVDSEFEIETIVNEGFWWRFLYSNSVLVKEQTIYIGMRGGVLRTQMNNSAKQEWLTKTNY